MAGAWQEFSRDVLGFGQLAAMARFDVATLSFVAWDGALTSPGGVNIGTVTQGAGGLSPWLIAADSLPLPTGASTEATLLSMAPLINAYAYRTDTFTGTTTGVTVDTSGTPLKWFSVQVSGTGGVPTLWTVVLEGSLDGVNFSPILTHTNTTGNGSVLWLGSNPATSRYFRSRVTGLTLGPATNIVVSVLGQS